MRNGYALCDQAGLEAISGYLAKLGPDESTRCAENLRIGVQSDVEVTDAPGERRPLVSQAFCSALPVAYTHRARSPLAAFASLVLEAAYEATMWSAVLNARRGASNVVLLTFLGGGAFGNEQSGFSAPCAGASKLVSSFDIDARIVSYGAPSPAVLAIAKDFECSRSSWSAGRIVKEFTPTLYKLVAKRANAFT